jgi:hypothetical protein
MALAWALIRHRSDLAAELRLGISALRPFLGFLSEFEPVTLLISLFLVSDESCCGCKMP